MTTYQVTLKKEPCDGIFACLTRDPRFVEDDDGLATIDPDGDPIYDDDDGEVREVDGNVIATFDDNRIEEARQAAAACPTNAIIVEEVDE